MEYLGLVWVGLVFLPWGSISYSCCGNLQEVVTGRAELHRGLAGKLKQTHKFESDGLTITCCNLWMILECRLSALWVLVCVNKTYSSQNCFVVLFCVSIRVFRQGESLCIDDRHKKARTTLNLTFHRAQTCPEWLSTQCSSHLFCLTFLVFTGRAHHVSTNASLHFHLCFKKRVYQLIWCIT